MGFAGVLCRRFPTGLKISRKSIWLFRANARKPGIPVSGAAIRLSPFGTGLAATFQATRGACACLALTCSTANSGDAGSGSRRAGHATRRSRLLPAGVRPLAGAPDPQGGPGTASPELAMLDAGALPHRAAGRCRRPWKTSADAQRTLAALPSFPTAKSHRS